MAVSLYNLRLRHQCYGALLPHASLVTYLIHDNETVCEVARRNLMLAMLS